MREEINEKNDAAKVNIRTFKTSAEIENLYRFISEFKLREEAKIVFENFFSQVKKVKKISKKNKNKSNKVH